MSKENSLLLWFDELRRDDVPIVGGKSSSLGEMTSQTKVPIPYGFATTAYSYRYFIKKSGLEKKIAGLLKTLPDVEDSAQLKKVSRQIREAIMAGKMPEDLQKAIASAYAKLGERAGEQEPFVAVRSSATAEDLPDASFAGQQDTYLNVKGAAEIIAKIKECYASTFTDRALYYRTNKGFDHLEVALSAVVQMMVYSKASGVMFTVDIVSGNDKDILIEAAWGLGEYVVQGVVTPDRYIVEKGTGRIIDREVSEQSIMMVRAPGGGVREEKVPTELIGSQVLSDEQIRELSSYALDIERHYGCYMDIEWGIDERTGKTWILQARPETVWSKHKKSGASAESGEQAPPARKVLVKGLPASPGKAAGHAKIILDPSRIGEFKEGEILVTEMTAPDWVPAMKKARAIVTDSGGTTCHASIVSRELGIPCIVGTKSRGVAATAAIGKGAEITVDASNGVVYEGRVDDLAKKASADTPAAAPAAETFPVTGVKIYMNLGDPELAEKHSELPCDGIGLMREEFIWTTYIHEHPLYLIETGRADKVVDSLAEGVRKVCQPFSPRPVILRFSDFKSSEYRDLTGGDKFEPHEPSALLGWRGASRYYDPKYSAAFQLELKAVKKVREEYGLKNLHVMIPFCRTVEEAEKVTGIMAQEGLVRGADFKVWLMAEIPSNIILADQFNKYVDGYSIGSNDLTMLILGCDRDNDTVAHIYDERNLAVKRALRHLIETAHKDGKTVSICGQAPSVYPEFTEFLIKSGVDSISVNPDAVKFTKKMAAQAEQRIILDALTKRGKAEDPAYEW
ncbi:MAG: phosphoenolpyruvate synthase [Acidaminococcales bacterium]|jgi:pyruvate,water dikinase|nr:phosphoenolpyruvate synthase [Acidaminococcales bacterium]